MTPRQAARAHATEARAAVAAGDAKNADRLFDASFAAEPSLAVSKDHVALLLADKQLSRAVEIARRYVEEKPGDIEGLVLLGDTYLATGQTAEAASIAAQTKDFDEGFGPGQVLRGRVLIAQGRSAEAVAELRPVAEASTDPMRLALYAVALSDDGKHKEAMRVARSVVPDANDAEVLAMIGGVARVAGALDDADSYLERAVALDKNNARARFEAGVLANKRDNQAKALDHLTIAVRLDATQPKYWYAYGEILRVTGQAEKAAMAYRQALVLMPPHPKAAGKLGVVLAELGRHEEAEVLLTARVRAEPNNMDHLLGLADVYAASKKPRLAAETYQKFLELAPSDDANRERAQRALVELKKK